MSSHKHVLCSKLQDVARTHREREEQLQYHCQSRLWSPSKKKKMSAKAAGSLIGIYYILAQGA